MMMTRYFLRYALRRLPLLGLALALAAPLARAQTQAPSKVSIDLKTPMFEKPILTAAKNGTELMLMQSDWASVAELGEDYAVWLHDLQRESHDDSITVTLEVELRAPSTFAPGDLISSRTIVATYAASDDWALHGTPDAVRAVKQVERYVDMAMLTARILRPGATFIVEAAWSALDHMMPDALPHMKLEAMLLGAKVSMATRDMIDSARHAGSTSARGAASQGAASRGAASGSGGSSRIPQTTPIQRTRPSAPAAPTTAPAAKAPAAPAQAPATAPAPTVAPATAPAPAEAPPADSTGGTQGMPAPGR